MCSLSRYQYFDAQLFFLPFIQFLPYDSLEGFSPFIFSGTDCTKSLNTVFIQKHDIAAPPRETYVVLDFVPDALSFRKLITLTNFGNDSLAPETFHHSIQEAIVYSLRDV